MTFLTYYVRKGCCCRGVTDASNSATNISSSAVVTPKSSTRVSRLSNRTTEITKIPQTDEAVDSSSISIVWPNNSPV